MSKQILMAAALLLGGCAPVAGGAAYVPAVYDTPQQTAMPAWPAMPAPAPDLIDSLTSVRHREFIKGGPVPFPSPLFRAAALFHVSTTSARGIETGRIRS